VNLKTMIVLLLCNAVGLSAQAHQDQHNSARQVYVFRLADLGDGEPNLGHCTGWLDPDANRVITAAHCYHNKPMRVVNQVGETISDLSEGTYRYAVSAIGLLDVFIIDDLSASQVEQIQNSIPLQEVPVTDGVVLLGYPASRRDQEITVIDCNFQHESFNVFRIQLERSIGVDNLSCWFRGEVSAENESEQVNHENVKGLSGGPAVYPDGSIGVAFHLIKESDTDLETVKTNSMDEIVELLDPLSAQRRFQLNRKLFEQVKVPNSVRLGFDDYMMGQGHFSFFLSFVAEDHYLGDNQWRFEFKNGENIDVSSEVFLRATKAALQRYASYLNTSGGAQ
jgi:hypothetical protein